MVKMRPADCEDVLTTLRQSRQISESEVAAVEKDMHLIAAARSAERSFPAANRAILSLDEVVRHILRKLTAETHALDRLHWTNPSNEFESLNAWLVEGRQPAASWRLTAADIA
jgi:hypothetical protein